MLSAATAAPACADSPATVRLEVYTWWQERSEAEALEALRQVHRKKYKNVEIEDLGDPTSDDTRPEMAGRLLSGAPPATFLANAGANLLSWTVVDAYTERDAGVLDGGVESTRWIHGLSDLFGKVLFNDRSLESRLHPELREQLQVGSRSVPYAVPINIHRLNVLYYNPEALDEFTGRDGNEDKSFLELGTLCPEGSYDPFDPALDLGLDIAVASGFAIVLLTFENVLPAIVARNGRDPQSFYVELFRGEEPGPRELGASTDVKEALKCVQYLSRWFVRVPDEDNPGLLVLPPRWAQAVNMVAGDLNVPQSADNGAAFTVMGDWANGVLAPHLGNQRVKKVSFPGTEDLFVYTSDTFPLPIGTEHPREVNDLLETISSPAAQLAFSAKKGSIPALRGLDLSSLEQWQEDAYFDFENKPRVLANSGYFPPYYPQGELQTALVNMVALRLVGAGAEGRRDERDAALDEALRVFTSNEPLLKHWQARLEMGAGTAIKP
jgi:glucose/mannose transport system substrate-binding protein